MPIDRRKFLATAGAAIMLNPFDHQAKPKTMTAAPGFSLTLLATNWGFSGSWDEFALKAKNAGYDGVEMWWPTDEKERDKIFTTLAKNNLKFGFLWGSGDTDFDKHEQEFQRGLNDAVKSKPLYVNCHSGKDFFSADQKSKLISFTSDLTKRASVPIYHETHRGRALYSAPVTKELIDRNPDMRITLDVSHWCNVHESLLADQEKNIAATLERTDHIHARIGHPEGPQVNDPRAPEWEPAVKAHFSWWDKIVETKKKSGKPLTILTEFGPPDYMPTTPYTRQPLANQWEINVYMMETLRKRYL